jgi:hypothetical protein
MSVGSQPPQTTRIAGEDEVVVITHEDVDRAHDRVRVSEARAMLSYAATGAKFGIGFFIPFVALT